MCFIRTGWDDELNPDWEIIGTPNDIYWETVDGNRILIKDLTNNHLINIYKMISNKNSIFMPIIKEEMNRRNL
jgi:hypothetical protein